MSFELDGAYYHINWTIQTFDRKKKQLPFELHHYRLDGSRLSEEQKRSIVALLRPATMGPSTTGWKPGVTITVSHSVRRDCSSMLFYRPLFQRTTDAELQNGDCHMPRTTLSVPALDRYVEDEFGRPMTMTEVIRIVAGRDDIILLGDIESVLSVGPVSPRSTQTWSTDTANLIHHFLETVEQLLASEWAKAPVSMAFTPDKPSPQDCFFPISHQTRSVAILFRQIWSKNPSDDVLNRACNFHIEYSSSEPKRQWVRHEQLLFNRALQSPPHFPPGVIPTPVVELLDTVFYGAKIGHAQSRHNAEQELALLIKQHGGDRIRFAFHSALRDLLSYAQKVYFPIKQDYEHWLSTGLVGPNLVGLAEF